jgi:hypothetical protein
VRQFVEAGRGKNEEPWKAVRRSGFRFQEGRGGTPLKEAVSIRSWEGREASGRAAAAVVVKAADSEEAAGAGDHLGPVPCPLIFLKKVKKIKFEKGY